MGLGPLALGVLAAGVVLRGSPASEASQPEPSILSVELRAADYGLQELQNVVRGQVAVAHTADGPRLGVWSLAEQPPPVLPVALASAAPVFGGGCFDVGAERNPVRNALGGQYGTYALGRSSATVDQDPDSEGRRALRVRCQRADGACGLWIQLFESSDPLRRSYLDASELSTLVFWARVSGSWEGVQLKAADAAWSRREDALPLGELARFAEPGPSASGWRRVEVPLAGFPQSLARDSLASIVVDLGSEGSSELEVAAVQLCRAGAEATPLPPAAREMASAQDAGHRALWVWNTRELLSEESARSVFLGFVKTGGFDRIFLQLVPAEGRRPEAGFVPFDGDRMGTLVAELRELGAEVYALDGDPAYALPENHAGVRRTVDAVLEHNRAAPPNRRFHGVRYDIEPYLLPAFRGDEREALLSGYLDLIAALSRARGTLRLGVDLPFWLDAPEETTGTPISLSWRGNRRTLLDHVVRLVDDIAIMAYRTSAYGADGSLSQSHGELEVAAAAGTAVYVGLETEILPDEEVYSFRGAAVRGLPPLEGGPWIVLGTPRGGAPRLWLVPSGQVALFEREAAEAGADRTTLFHWKTDPPSMVLADRQSFHGLGLARMEAEAARLLRELGGKAGFAGLAYHHYGSLVKLSGADRTEGLKERR